MKIIFVLFYTFLFSCKVLLCQTDSIKIKERQLFLLDSLKQKLTADSIHIYRFQKLRPYFGFDNRNSFIRNAPISIYGLQAGIILNERHTLGIGGYTISKGTSKPVVIKGQSVETLRELTLNYLTFFYQYTLTRKRFYELHIPVEMGVGKYDIKLTASASGKTLYNKKNVMIPLGAAFQVIVKPFKWIGISSMLGYRFVADIDPNLNFNGWYYAYGVWVDIRQIIRDTRYYLIKKPKYRKNVHYLNMEIK